MERMEVFERHARDLRRKVLYDAIAEKIAPNTPKYPPYILN